VHDFSLRPRSSLLYRRYRRQIDIMDEYRRAVAAGSSKHLALKRLVVRTYMVDHPWRPSTDLQRSLQASYIREWFISLTLRTPVTCQVRANLNDISAQKCFGGFSFFRHLYLILLSTFVVRMPSVCRESGKYITNANKSLMSFRLNSAKIETETLAKTRKPWIMSTVSKLIWIWG